jgi:hypothetical protein
MVWRMSKSCARIINEFSCFEIEMPNKPIDVNQSKIGQLPPKVDDASVDTFNCVVSTNQWISPLEA